MMMEIGQMNGENSSSSTSTTSSSMNPSNSQQQLNSNENSCNSTSSTSQLPQKPYKPKFHIYKNLDLSKNAQAAMISVSATTNAPPHNQITVNIPTTPSQSFFKDSIPSFVSIFWIFESFKIGQKNHTKDYDNSFSGDLNPLIFKSFLRKISLPDLTWRDY